jgi:hypothetical protein
MNSHLFRNIACFFISFALVTVATYAIRPSYLADTPLIAHGLYHANIINEIRSGIIPPTNPLVMEAPVISYWGWHMILAIPCMLFGLESTTALYISNIIAISLLALCLWSASSFFGRAYYARILTLLCPLLVTFLSHALFKTENLRIDMAMKLYYFTAFPLGIAFVAYYIKTLWFNKTQSRRNITT